MKKITSRLALALSFISFLFYLIPDDSAEASSAPPISDVTILGPGNWDRDGVGEGDSSLWPGYLYMAVQVMGYGQPTAYLDGRIVRRAVSQPYFFNGNIVTGFRDFFHLSSKSGLTLVRHVFKVTYTSNNFPFNSMKSAHHIHLTIP